MLSDNFASSTKEEEDKISAKLYEEAPLEGVSAPRYIITAKFRISVPLNCFSLLEVVIFPTQGEVCYEDLSLKSSTTIANFQRR